MSFRVCVAAALLGSLALSRPAWAQDAKARAEAKKLEKEANTLIDNGDCAGALKKFERLSEIATIPLPARVRAARCFEKLGQLIEAAERYESIATTSIPPNASRADLDAVDTAKSAGASVEKRIPQAVISFQGLEDPLRVQVEVVLDGASFPRTKIGVKHAVDPGEHVVEAVAERSGQKQTARARFAAVEGETVEVPLRFGDEKGAAAKPAGAAPPPGETSDYWGMLKRGRSTQRTIGWVVVGTGGVVFLAGGATTLVALGVKSSLDEQCGTKRLCPPEAHGDVDTYDTLQTLTTVFYVGGLVGVITGIALLATSPRERTLGAAPRAPAAKIQDVEVSPWIGLGSAGLTGSF